MFYSILLVKSEILNSIFPFDLDPISFSIVNMIYNGVISKHRRHLEVFDVLIFVRYLLSGNAPIVNGRQSDNDGSEGDSNVDDERGGGAAAGYPPPGVGLPAASTMQQQPVYQMMPPFSNLYVGSVPSAVNVQGFVNSPIPYPHPYSAMASSAELATATNNAGGGRGGSGNRSGAGGKAAAGKIGADKGLQNSTDSSPYNAAGGPLQPQDANATAANDLSAPTLPPTMAPPPHPQANLMPFGAMQYGYSYFPQAGHHPPPPHLTSAQHAAGSPLYIPHPSMPVYHGPIYSSGPAAAVFSTDNGLPPHSAVSAAPISMPPPADLVVASHEVEPVITSTASASVSAKAPSADGAASANAAPNTSAVDEVDQAKQSNLMVDSAPYQPDGQKGGAATFVPDNAPAIMNASTPVGSTENVATVGLHAAVDSNAAAPVAETDKQSTSVQSNNNSVAKEVALLPAEVEIEVDVETVDPVTEVSVYPTVGDNNVSSGRKADAKEAVAAPVADKAKSVAASGTTTTTESLSNGPKGAQQPDCGDHAAVETASHTSESGSNESKSSGSPESVNGKSNSSESANSSGFESGVSKLSSTVEKEETSEESSPPPSAATKTWASLFKGPSSSSAKSKASPAAAAASAASRLSSNEASANSASAPLYAQNADSAIHSSSSSLAGHTSSLNGGVPVAQCAIKSPSYRYSSSSSMSLADDTALPKIGGESRFLRFFFFHSFH